MSTRGRARFLLSEGFEKSPVAFTRGATTYRLKREGKRDLNVTFPLRRDTGANFMIVGGCVTFQSALMGIGNTSENVRRHLSALYEQTGEVPDPGRADYGSPEYLEELFRGLVYINMHYDAAEDT